MAQIDGWRLPPKLRPRPVGRKEVVESESQKNKGNRLGTPPPSRPRSPDEQRRRRRRDPYDPRAERCHPVDNPGLLPRVKRTWSREVAKFSKA